MLFIINTNGTSIFKIENRADIQDAGRKMGNALQSNRYLDQVILAQGIGVYALREEGSDEIKVMFAVQGNRLFNIVGKNNTRACDKYMDVIEQYATNNNLNIIRRYI